MDPVCLLVAGVVRATLPAAEFTLAWDHSVQKTRWEERYRVDGDRLRLVEARVRGTGAGMEPPPAATLADGIWSWQPGTVVAALTLARSPFAGDYVFCAGGDCRPLEARLGAAPAGLPVVVRPCAAGAPPR